MLQGLFRKTLFVPLMATDRRCFGAQLKGEHTKGYYLFFMERIGVTCHVVMWKAPEKDMQTFRRSFEEGAEKHVVILFHF